MLSIHLPLAGGHSEDFTFSSGHNFQPYKKKLNRVAYSAVHIVADTNDDTQVDWDASLRYRKYLWDCNLGVAEAMDTAQRGTGLEWSHAKELIRRSIDAAKGESEALLVSGCGTDQLELSSNLTLTDVINAYEEQIGFVEGLGGRVVMMASRALASIAKSPDDYAEVYHRILSQVKQPVIIHWLGEMFDPALKGYWGSLDHYDAMYTVVEIITDRTEKVDGIKVSLLDKEKEIALRKRLPEGVRMYTGDDFNFPELIEGDQTGHSDALLGIFDVIAPAASAALGALAEGDHEQYNEILAPCLPLSRHIFSEPTRFYKTGVVFMAWLNGFQNQFTMLGGEEKNRSMEHLAELFRLAAGAGLLRDPEMAMGRMKDYLSSQGFHA